MADAALLAGLPCRCYIAQCFSLEPRILPDGRTERIRPWHWSRDHDDQVLEMIVPKLEGLELPGRSVPSWARAAAVRWRLPPSLVLDVFTKLSRLIVAYNKLIWQKSESVTSFGLE